MTKKRSSKIVSVKMEFFFLKNGHSKIIWSSQFFSVPQTRRQVSAYVKAMSHMISCRECSESDCVESLDVNR